MKFQKGNTKGKKFGDGQPINMNGRPKKMLTKFKEVGYNKSQVRETFAAISGLSETELQKVIDDNDSTVLEITVAKSFRRAMKDGDYKFVKEIVEMFADKATQHKEIKVEKTVKYSHMDDGELDKLIKKKMEFSKS